MSRLTRRPNIMAGALCVEGTRIPAATVVSMVRSGMSEDEIIADFPQLTSEDIAAAVEHDAQLHSEHDAELRGMSHSVRDPVAIQAEIRSLLQLVRDERAMLLGEFDDLTALILSADRADARDDERDALCVQLQDLSHSALGDCEPVATLLALLGYEDPAERDDGERP